jgi:hypothetical protein
MFAYLKDPEPAMKVTFILKKEATHQMRCFEESGNQNGSMWLSRAMKS